MLRRFGLMLILSLHCSACSANWGEVEASSNDEMAERQAIDKAVVAAIERRDYVALNAMAADYRTKRSRTPSGTWKLSIYYGALFFYLPEVRSSPNCPQPDDGFVDAWIAAHPAEPAALIAKARLLYGYAFCLRGSASASRTTGSQMTGFQEQINRAISMFEKHRDVASTDPQFYAESIRLHGAGGLGRAIIPAILDEGTGKEPYFYETYFAANDYYRPRWWGLPGDQIKLARLAAGNTSQDGNGSYARVIWYLDEIDNLPRAEIDWPLMVEAMEDVVEKYPTDWNHANFGRLACKLGDYATAKRHLLAVVSDDSAAWKSEEEREFCLKTKRFVSPGALKP